MITQFTIFKNKEVKDEKQPTHYLSAKVGEEFQHVGVCWTKENANGKFLSCQMNKPYMDKVGYKIVEEKNNASAEPEDVASDSSPF